MRIQVALTCRARACLDEDLKAILLVLLLWNLVLMGTLLAPSLQPPSPSLASLSPATRHRLMEAGVNPPQGGQVRSREVLAKRDGGRWKDGGDRIQVFGGCPAQPCRA